MPTIITMSENENVVAWNGKIDGVIWMESIVNNYVRYLFLKETFLYFKNMFAF